MTCTLMRHRRNLPQEHELQALWQRVVGRRSFLKQAAIVGAAAVPFSALATSSASAQSTGPTDGDIAILRFLAAAEILETDLWEQYNELGGLRRWQPGIRGGAVEHRFRRAGLHLRQYA